MWSRIQTMEYTEFSAGGCDRCEHMLFCCYNKGTVGLGEQVGVESNIFNYLFSMV